MRAAVQLTRGLLRREQGSLMIESALALLLVMPVVFWVFELSMLIYTAGVLGEAARQGVRYAIVHGTDTSNCSGPSTGCADAAGAHVVSVVDSYAAYSFHNLSQMTVHVSYPDNSSAPSSRVNVTIAYTYVPYVQLPGIAQNLALTAEGRVIY